MAAQNGVWVVCKPGKHGPLYLDDTGAGVHDRAQAKRFRSEEDAWAGIHIAELAPTGGEAREWRIARLR
jgi:hypothetical protein